MSLTLQTDVSAQLQIALDYFNCATYGDINRLSDLLSDDMTFHMVPPTVERVLNKQQMKSFVESTFGAMGSSKPIIGMKFEVLDFVEVPGRVWLYTQGSSIGTIIDKPYNNRYVQMMDIAIVGSELKITRIREMLDTTLLVQHKFLEDNQ